MKKEIIEKYKNDKIIKLCIEILDKINKMKKEEDNINEIEYQGLINNIECLIGSRITYLNFWEEE